MSDTSIIPTKYPELTDEKLKGLTPADDKCPISHESRCISRQKVCKNTECQYRFLKSDRNDVSSWFCPKCGLFRRCKKAKLTGMNVCSHHGGGHPAQGKPGGGLPTKFTHTKWMPERLEERFNAALGDPELLSMKNQLATLDARWKDVISALDKPQMHKDNIKSIRKAIEEVDKGILDDVGFLEAVREAITDIRNEQETWEHSASLMEAQRKMVETEMKRMIAIGQVLTVEEANALVGRIRIIMLKNLKVGTVIDDTLIKQIQYELMELVHHRTGGLSQSRSPAGLEQIRE